MAEIDRRVSIAPMLGWTDRHARYFHRQISRHVLVYGEMLAPEALLLGRKERFLRLHPDEHPVAFQLGGSQPVSLAKAARVVQQAGFDEINFNVGCPSKKGEHLLFGAHLMTRPRLVADCVAAMVEAVDIPVTVKTRIGVDDFDSFDFLADFVGQVAQAGCRIFIIHARKAWLKGLSPRANRLIPPLDYPRVYRLKQEFPHLTVVVNGGIQCWKEARQHLTRVDGVMVGRQAYKEPHWLADVNHEIFGDGSSRPSQAEILKRCIPYVEEELARGTMLRDIMRPMVGLYRKAPAATAFRRHIALQANPAQADLDVFLEAVRISQATQRKARLPDAI